EERLQLRAFAAGKRIGNAVKVRRPDRHALRARLVEEDEQRLGVRDLSGIALDLHPVLPGRQLHVQRALGMHKVFLTRGVEGADVTGTRKMKSFGRHGGWDRSQNHMRFTFSPLPGPQPALPPW